MSLKETQQHVANVERADSLLAESRSALFVDGQPRHAPGEMTARENEANRKYRETLDNASAFAAQELSDIAAERKMIEARELSVIGSLDRSDLQRANLLAVFVTEDVARLPVAILPQQLADAIKDDDKALIAVMVRCLPQRINDASSEERTHLEEQIGNALNALHGTGAARSSLEQRESAAMGLSTKLAMTRLLSSRNALASR